MFTGCSVEGFKSTAVVRFHRNASRRRRDVSELERSRFRYRFAVATRHRRHVVVAVPGGDRSDRRRRAAGVVVVIVLHAGELPEPRQHQPGHLRQRGCSRRRSRWTDRRSRSFRQIERRRPRSRRGCRLHRDSASGSSFYATISAADRWRSRGIRPHSVASSQRNTRHWTH